MIDRIVAHKTPLVALPSSGSTDDITTPPAWPSFTTSSSVAIVPAGESQTRRHALMPRAWHTTMKAFAVATLPFADVYDAPQRLLIRRGNYVIVIGEQLASDVYEEPDAIFATHPDRPTLWLSNVRILDPRRPFISPWTLPDDE
jgi:hypothetical protein